MLRGSTDLKGNFQGSLKGLQLRRICVPVEHRRPLGRMYRVRHPLTEIRHVSLEHWVPVWFLPPVTRAVVAENYALACGFLKFSSYFILAFFPMLFCKWDCPIVAAATHFDRTSLLSLFPLKTPPLSLLHLCTSSLRAPFSHPDNWNISKLLWHFLPSPLSLFQIGGFVQCWNP